MKKPETPKPNASANSADTKKSTDTISVDSKGNASPDPKKADAAPASKPSPSAADSSKPGNNTTEKPSSNTSPDGPAKPASSGAKPNDSPKPDTSKTAPKAEDTNPSEPAKRKGYGGKALVLFVVIIIGALAVGWLTRAIWWRDAEPILSQYVPDQILAEITPDDLGTDNAQSTDITLTNEPVASDTATSNTVASNTGASDTAEDDSANTLVAPNQEAPIAENDDAAVEIEDFVPVVSDTASDMAASTAIPEESVVIDPELTERLSRLEGTIDALRERLNNERGDTLSNSVARRLAEIETRSTPIEELARVESELAGVANEMRELSARLSTMEEEVRATEGLRVESRGQAIAMAVSILRDALQRGGPFVIALNQLERSAGDDVFIAGQLAILKPLADQGAPTIEQLRQSFPAMAQKAVQAGTDDHSGSVLDATWANIKKLVPVRRIDAAGEESLEGRLVLAENALAQNDLDAAVIALKGVEGDHAAAAVSEWLSEAEHRQTLNEAIADLSAHAIGLLTGTEGGQ
ncbi:MAG: uroporphyrinogen III synthase [Rhodospirillales bacterium]|nr:uroporphyrinogen III synthase [Rhodospirillales bacterium]